jgi:catechol 2,3-dioxygenase-like lactoylglutathione lyase family enzyme
MPVLDISHVTLVVKDLERMSQFLCQGLGAEEIYDSVDKNFSVAREKYFLVGGVWLAAMEGESPVARTYQHLAFKVDEAELPLFHSRLEKLGVEIKAPRTRVEGEGKSLYFYDFDNHLFELHTGSLEKRLVSYAAQN